MDISRVSQRAAMEGMAGAEGSENVQKEIAVAIMKQIQEQQRREAQALVKMIKQSSSNASAGNRVNVYA